MTELVPRPVLCLEVFCNHIGAATLGGWRPRGSICSYIIDCFGNHGRRPLLVRTHDHCLPRRLRRLVHKCTSPPLLNDVTSLPPNHSNSHSLFLYKPGPPWPIEMTKRSILCPVLLMCFPTPPSLVIPLLWAHVSLPAYVH
jgi:hypothetical protein